MKAKFRITLFGLFLISLGCHDHDIQSCVAGTVVGYEQCSNAVLIQVDNKNQIGRNMTYYDKSSYDNVVRAPGELGQYGNTTIYFNYRSYNADQDDDLFKYSTLLCLAVYGPFDVPTVVITDFSTENCSE
jgi:hypothetical protein